MATFTLNNVMDRSILYHINDLHVHDNEVYLIPGVITKHFKKYFKKYANKKHFSRVVLNEHSWSITYKTDKNGDLYLMLLTKYSGSDVLTEYNLSTGDFVKKRLLNEIFYLQLPYIYDEYLIYVKRGTMHFYDIENYKFVDELMHHEKISSFKYVDRKIYFLTSTNHYNDNQYNVYVYVYVYDIPTCEKKLLFSYNEETKLKTKRRIFVIDNFIYIGRLDFANIVMCYDLAKDMAYYRHIKSNIFTNNNIVEANKKNTKLYVLSDGHMFEYDMLAGTLFKTSELAYSDMSIITQCE